MDIRHTQNAVGMHAVKLARASCKETFITMRRQTGESAEDMFRKAAEIITADGLQVVSQEVFGFREGEGRPALASAVGQVTWPITWLEPYPDTPETMAGTQVWAVQGAKTAPLMRGGAPVGVTMSDGESVMCRLGGLTPPDVTLQDTEQAAAMFKVMMDGLTAAGMTFSDVARTWFHNRDILDWYGPFNEVRDAFFREHGVFDGVVPASTGVAGLNPRNAALTGGLLAARVPDAGTVRPLPSPLQNPALDYGSSFSRAVEIDLPDHHRILISGTASIDAEGRTVHLDDIDNQVALTMDVAHAILESRGMSWPDTSRAIAYFKEPEYVAAFERHCAAEGIPTGAFLFAHNDICRHDLLFEIELDAVALKTA